jgi:hypothetical protein
MAVWVAKVKPPAAFARIQLSILEASGFASVRKPGLLHALKDRIELTIANMKSVVVMLKGFRVIEIKGQLLIDADRGKVPSWTGILKSEDLREKTRGGLLVTRGHDSVIQLYALKKAHRLEA